MSLKKVHSVEIECFQYPTEDPAKLERLLLTLTGEKPSATAIESFYGGEIQVLRISIKKVQKIMECVRNIREAMGPAELEAMLSSVSDVMDESGGIHMRFSKQAALAGRLVPQYGGDVVKVKARIAAYPANRERLRRAALEVFS